MADRRFDTSSRAVDLRWEMSIVSCTQVESITTVRLKMRGNRPRPMQRDHPRRCPSQIAIPGPQRGMSVGQLQATAFGTSGVKSAVILSHGIKQVMDEC